MIRRLLYFNGLAAIGAVLYHATGWGYTAMFWWTDRYRAVAVPNFDQFGSVSYFGLRGIEQFVIAVIPIFLFVSGFFIAFATGRKRRTLDWHIVGARVKNLVIPYLLWSVIIIAAAYGMGTRYSGGELLRMLALGDTAPPYYYVPLLIQLYLLAPFLVPLARSRWKLLLAVTLIIQLTAISVRYTNTIGVDVPALKYVAWMARSWFFPGHLFWFSFGIVAGFHLPALKQWAAKARWWMLGATVILFFAGMFEWETLLQLSGKEWIASQETIIDGVYSIALLLTFIGFDKIRLPSPKRISDIGVKSFGIYLIHSPVLEFSSRLIYHFVPWVLAYQILYQPILVILGLAVPLLLMAAVKKSPVHPFYQYIFG